MNIVDFPMFVILKFYYYLDDKSAIMLSRTCKLMHKICPVKVIKSYTELKNTNNKLVQTLVYNIETNLEPIIEVDKVVIYNQNVYFNYKIKAEELHIFSSGISMITMRYILQFVKNFKKFICNFELDLTCFCMPETLEHIEAPYVINNRRIKYIKCESYTGIRRSYVDKLICNHYLPDFGEGKELHIKYSEKYYEKYTATICMFEKIYFEGFKNLIHYKEYEITFKKNTNIYYIDCDEEFIKSIKFNI